MYIFYFYFFLLWRFWYKSITPSGIEISSRDILFSLQKDFKHSSIKNREKLPDVYFSDRMRTFS